MGNFFSKRWVTIVSILFICFMVYGFSADVSYAQNCYQCDDGSWQASCTICYGGGSPPCTNSYSLRSGYSCQQPCSRVTTASDGEACDYENMTICYNGNPISWQTPADNLYNVCVKKDLFKCTWGYDYPAATGNPSTWPTCQEIDGTKPYCSGSNWADLGGGVWGTWSGASPAECVAAGVGPYGK